VTCAPGIFGLVTRLPGIAIAKGPALASGMGAQRHYPVQKFQSDAERKLAVILEREALKWFKPAKGQFQIYYKWGADHPEYQPDFVAETNDRIFMLEPKASNQMTDAEVLAKRDVAVTWCKQASDHAASCGGKPWVYLLIPTMPSLTT
jgi:type III restriction enzyme